MRTILPAALLAALFASASLEAGEQFARSLAGQFAITSEQGWPGKRYIEGGVVFAEEFDTNRDNKIDLWRFYRRGALSSEEQDLNFDGRVDLVTTWNPRDPRVQRLTGVSHDTRRRGAYDFEMTALSDRRWRIQEDRNGDGIADLVLVAEGPYQFFEDLGLDVSAHPDVVSQVPLEYWVEYQADDGYCGFVTDYRRYSKGRQTHYGNWDGRKVTWVRYDPNNPPPPPAPPAQAMQTRPLSPSPSAPAPLGGPDDIYSADGGTQAAAPASPTVSDTFSDPFAGTGSPQPAPGADAGTGYYYDSSTLVDTAPQPALSDRTRYEGMPPGDSAARSLPARMRPPGVGPRR